MNFAHKILQKQEERIPRRGKREYWDKESRNVRFRGKIIGPSTLRISYKRSSKMPEFALDKYEVEAPRFYVAKHPVLNGELGKRLAGFLMLLMCSAGRFGSSTAFLKFERLEPTMNIFRGSLVYQWCNLLISRKEEYRRLLATFLIDIYKLAKEETYRRDGVLLLLKRIYLNEI